MCICFVFFCFAPVDNFSCYYFSIEYLQQTSQTRKKKNIIDGFSAFTRAQEGRDVGGGQMVGGHYTNSTHARKPSVMLTAGCIQFGIAEKNTLFFARRTSYAVKHWHWICKYSTSSVQSCILIDGIFNMSRYLLAFKRIVGVVGFVCSDFPSFYVLLCCNKMIQWNHRYTSAMSINGIALLLADNMKCEKPHSQMANTLEKLRTPLLMPTGCACNELNWNVNGRHIIRQRCTTRTKSAWLGHIVVSA